ncbi:type III secretion system LEE muramidase EtgA (plasmid) [Pseudomonas guariconensis]|uniref:lytic transglycosylase domain-containing protein n=1 Tax=Pseudomonas TaxID=286 RepID=UPI00076128CA|nr:MULTISPECIES: lytic transglycosylase domain-containing protein [Pseudomonas]
MKKLSLPFLLVGALTGYPTAGHADCFAEAAERYRVSEKLLRAIQVTENRPGKPDVVSPKNSDGTWDIGLMQINSSWLPKLSQFGIGEKELLDRCVSANVGAWILASNIASHGPVWKAVGAYNSPNAESQRIYIQKVMNNYGGL